ncbi:uncharacterized protein LOC142634702 [Castanea sativa]|uniref:uncharacterized protein LOC142634702 n=1 Tax=Castanea sativa TaxID=21020 RepID=UPI003F64B6B6
MEKMGFHSRWVGWIMECIKSVTYSVLINGEPRGYIVPTRGIRQGDPLSPYLFLLCSEGLSDFIEQAVNERYIKGFSLCKHGPKISHLFFADDSLLFCRAREEDVIKIQVILGKYEVALGQKINSGKTTIFFSKNVSMSAKEQVQNLLGVPEIREYEKYLGLPAVVGRNKRASLNYIKDRVWGKLQGWKEKLLSQAGKEVLLKAVVQVISTFAMSCFRLLVGPCQNIEMLIPKSSSGSFTWKSILWERHLIEKGAQWRVGDGQSIRIFQDAWLPTNSGKISSHQSDLGPDATVAMLINPASGWWNTHLIDRHFYPPNAKLIKSLPLCSIPQNKLRLDEASTPRGRIRRFARDYLRDFKNLTSIPSCPVRTTPRRWCPPADDMWKINFDGAMFGESDEAGIGVVI